MPWGSLSSIRFWNLHMKRSRVSNNVVSDILRGCFFAATYNSRPSLFVCFLLLNLEERILDYDLHWQCCLSQNYTEAIGTASIDDTRYGDPPYRSSCACLISFSEFWKPSNSWMYCFYFSFLLPCSILDHFFSCCVHAATVKLLFMSQFHSELNVKLKENAREALCLLEGEIEFFTIIVWTFVTFDWLWVWNHVVSNNNTMVILKWCSWLIMVTCKH